MILSPTQGAELGPSFKVDADVQAAQGVSRVVLRVRGGKVSELTAPLFSFQLSGRDHRSQPDGVMLVDVPLQGDNRRPLPSKN